MADLELDIGRLHQAYRDGADVVAIVDAVFRRIRSRGRPGHLHHACRRGGRQGRGQGPAAVRPGREAALGRAFCRQGQHRRRRSGDDRRLPGVRLRPANERPGRRPAGRCGGHPHRQDQSRPVRHRPRRRAHALPGAPERGRRAARARRFVIRLGGGGGARARFFRPRHRHRRLRTGAGGTQQHRRPEADARAHFPRAAWFPHAGRSIAFRSLPAPSTTPGRSHRWPPDTTNGTPIPGLSRLAECRGRRWFASAFRTPGA